MDLTPEEMRRLFGLPDMQPIHEEMLNRMKKEMEENMDPAKLIENYMTNSAASMEAFQRMLGTFASGGSKSDK
jgi:hypothetical protein